MSEDKIIQKLLDHDEQLQFIRENMATKEDLGKLHGEMLNGWDRMDNMVTKQEHREVMDILEGISTIVQRLDQERIFTSEWIKRIENEINNQKIVVDEHTKLLKEMRVQLKIA